MITLNDLKKPKFRSVDQVYRDYQIPPNVVEHMEWVAQVAEEVLTGWVGPAVDGELTLLSARLHDLGNIVKFRRPFTGKIANKLLDNLDHWYVVQDRFITKYGTDANQVTHQILAELGLTGNVGRVLSEMEQIADHYLYSVSNVAPDSEIGYEARILEYADCRVSPEGIVSFETRMKDLCDRYGRDCDGLWSEALKENAVIIETNTQPKPKI
jgi:hypothetical protein